MPESRNGPGGIDVAIRRLGQLATLDPREVAHMKTMPHQRQSIEPKAEIVDGHRGWPKILLSGWAVRSKTLRDGRRQTISFLLPGDVVSLQRGSPSWSETTVSALNSVDLLDAGWLVEELATMFGERSGFGAACIAGAASEEGLILDHVVRLGVRGATERMAHLFLELCERLSRVGLCDGESCAFPPRQDHLAEALGMSVVHVNRTLQKLRTERLLTLRAGRLTILQPERMQRLAQFETPAFSNSLSGASPALTQI